MFLNLFQKRRAFIFSTVGRFCARSCDVINQSACVTFWRCLATPFSESQDKIVRSSSLARSYRVSEGCVLRLDKIVVALCSCGNLSVEI